MIPRLDPPHPLVLALVALSWGTIAACVAVLREAISGRPVAYGEMSREWMANRAFDQGRVW